jgi:H+/Cl- antiporter ClcA
LPPSCFPLHQTPHERVAGGTTIDVGMSGATKRPVPAPAPTLEPDSKRRLLARIQRASGLRDLGDLLRGRVQSPQLSLQILGRVLLHAALVGAAAGLVGSLFVAGLDLVQRRVLEGLTGYLPLRAAGEATFEGIRPPPFRPWLLWIVPAVGALAGGAISVLAPETRGGGSDAIIEAFHRWGGKTRRRVPLVKMLASIFTLGFGGSGGR